MYRSLIVAFCLLFSIHSLANEKAEQAAAAYDERDFNAEGIKNAQKAASLYAEAVAAETDAFIKAKLMLDQATAHYFLGTALTSKKDRKAEHKTAMDISDAVMTMMGVNPKSAHELSQTQVTEILDKFGDDEEYVIADALYSKGVNLGQWGRLNGIPSSIGQLPEVMGLMERIEMLGQEDIHEYGPYRTIGRINFILPQILGGDLKKSEKFLKDAYRKSLVPGTQYSVNGYNNVYLAETLYKQGKETQAIKLIELFLAADPSTLKADSGPENKESLRLAQELLDDWL